MFKQIKTIVLCAGLLAALLGTGAALAAKPKAAEAAPAAAAPAPAPAAEAAPAASEVAPAVAAAPAPAAEEENPYGLSALWSQGDFVAKGTLLILIIMSMGSWYVIFTKFAEQAKINKQAREAQDNFWLSLIHI